MLLNAVEGRDLPIYGDGKNVRDWLFVEDHCAGILLALEQGRPGEKYNIGGHGERSNIELLDLLLEGLEAELPARENRALQARRLGAYGELKKLVPDRPGHDRRYAIDATKIERELGWRPRHELAAGLRETVRWYLANGAWCESVQRGTYDRRRLGLGEESGSAAPR
jgi:dTDP-glucose 4,6-dehydratase